MSDKNFNKPSAEEMKVLKSAMSSSPFDVFNPLAFKGDPWGMANSVIAIVFVVMIFVAGFLA